MNEAWIALIGTLFGGAGFKVIEHFLARKTRKVDVATSLRGELHTEVSSLRSEATKLREETDDLRDEIDNWRTKYYSLVGSIASGDLKEALRKITEGNNKID